MLLTTQYLEEADRLCKQLVVLDHGRIIAEGTSQQLKTRLGNTVLALTFANTSDANLAGVLVKDLSDTPANIDGTVVEVTVANGPAAAADALRRIDAGNIALTGLTLREPSLDDVFLSLTGHKAEEEEAPIAEDAHSRSPRKARS